MHPTLFDVPETLSPRLEWIKLHQIRTHYQALMKDEEVPWSAWLPIHDWDEKNSGCYSPFFEDRVGFGPTEDEALIACAIYNGIPLWNQ